MLRPLLATALFATLAAPAFAAAPPAPSGPIYFTAAAANATVGNAVRPASDVARQALASPVETPIYFYAHGTPAAADRQQLAATPAGSHIPAPGLPIYFRANKG